MINTYTRTYPATTKDNSANALQASITYQLGGFNIGSGRINPRGYYFKLQPITQTKNSISFIAFTGNSICIKPVSRQSKKAYEQAKASFDDLLDTYLKNFCETNNITINPHNFTEEEREKKCL